MSSYQSKRIANLVICAKWREDRDDDDELKIPNMYYSKENILESKICKTEVRK